MMLTTESSDGGYLTPPSPSPAPRHLAPPLSYAPARPAATATNKHIKYEHEPIASSLPSPSIQDDPFVTHSTSLSVHPPANQDEFSEAGPPLSDEDDEVLPDPITSMTAPVSRAQSPELTYKDTGEGLLKDVSLEDIPPSHAFVDMDNEDGPAFEQKHIQSVSTRIVKRDRRRALEEGKTFNSASSVHLDTFIVPLDFRPEMADATELLGPLAGTSRRKPSVSPTALPSFSSPPQSPPPSDKLQSTSDAPLSNAGFSASVGQVRAAPRRPPSVAFIACEVEPEATHDSH
ncbi:hypothetical protein DFH11DRAFT_1630953 [Phellopilus nigrolimitatus]|nr:hypothetical protein DFH11DRAFT_1630953 [Phellopilus nigrolimitatus]